MEQDEIQAYQNTDNILDKKQKQKLEKMTITNLGVFMDVLNKCNGQLSHISPFTLAVNPSIQHRNGAHVLLKIHSELI